ncbi:hypothetical protein SAMN05444337_0780 [Flavobacterium haoranii]|uniref:Uncharacterized protein n=1 Tax=Flavobacterium haoranii TaxID=683124 RepID=A0A1M6DYG3_9FLAO|nr:hypothetical protein SAMN05444337_0780 [Flavobacterium haoranii]
MRNIIGYLVMIMPIIACNLYYYGEPSGGINL